MAAAAGPGGGSPAPGSPPPRSGKPARAGESPLLPVLNTHGQVTPAHFHRRFYLKEIRVFRDAFPAFVLYSERESNVAVKLFPPRSSSNRHSSAARAPAASPQPAAPLGSAAPAAARRPGTHRRRRCWSCCAAARRRRAAAIAPARSNRAPCPPPALHPGRSARGRHENYSFPHPQVCFLSILFSPRIVLEKKNNLEYLKNVLISVRACNSSR